MKSLSVNDRLSFFFSHNLPYIGRSHWWYWVRDGCTAIIFCKACQNCLRQSFVFVQFIMQRKQRQLGQKQFDTYHKIDCCAAIHGQIMNNIPNENRIIMLSCTNFFFLRFWDFFFFVTPRFPFFFFYSHCIPTSSSYLSLTGDNC